MATFVLGKNTKEVKSLISSNETKTINLDEKLPVYIAYITAWVRNNGRVVFFGDYYEHDKRMSNNFI